MAAQEQTERATPAAPAPKQYFKGTVKQVNVISRTSLFSICLKTLRRGPVGRPTFQVLDGGAVVIRGVPKGGPPPERTLALTNINAPRLAR